MTKLLLLALLGAVLLLSSTVSSASLDLSLDSNFISPTKDDQWEPLINDVIDDVDIIDDDDVIISEDLVDDTADDLADDDAVEAELTEEEKAVGDAPEFPVEDMEEDELKLYLSLEDRVFYAEADEHVAMKLLKEKRSLYTKGGDRLRRKRIAPLIARGALMVARGLARRFARSGITRSGTRVTRHYNGRGSYTDAVRDFNRMRPDNVRSFSKGGINGRTGTMGNHRVTVRDGSKGNSRPTMEIRSHGGDLVRKFRYNN